MRSNITLSIIALLSIGGFFVIENSKYDAKQNWYQEKYQASLLTTAALDTLKATYLNKGIYVDNMNDPNETGIIGQKYSEITSGSGSLPIKQSTANPNTSAMIVQLLKDAGLEKGDHVAICLTGSFPALNIATYSAMKILKLRPTIILSTTSSSWGANDPYYTFLDMEKILFDKGFFSFKSIAASIGANQDIGLGLSKAGRRLAKEAIERNNLPLIKGKTLGETIHSRMLLFEKNASESPIKLYINVGGGIASLGSKENGKSLPAGLNQNIKLKRIPDKIGVLYQMAKQDIDVLHLLNLSRLLKKYSIPEKPEPIPAPGSGELFLKQKYNVFIVSLITLFLLSCIVFVIYLDQKRNKLGTQIISKSEDDQQ